MGYSRKRNLDGKIQPKAKQLSLYYPVDIAKREHHTHRRYNKKKG